MAVDAFLKIEGIEGESQDSKHKGEIDVMSFSWGVANTGSFSAGGGAGAGKAQFQDLHFSAQTSKASPKLMLSCATGQHLKVATLTLRKAGGSQVEFMHIKFTDVLVSSYQTSGGGDVPTDSTALNFGRIEFSFTPQNADGAPGTPVHEGWDVRANRAV